MLSKISKVKTYIIEVPLRHEWKISLYAAKTRKHAIVEVITEDGIHGYGEASPSPAFMGETAETIKLIIDNYLASAVKGCSINHLSKIHMQMNVAIHGQSAAKSAIDIAVHDSWGKTMNQPIYELIGGAYREEIPLAYVIGIKSDQDAYDEAIQRINDGFSLIKVKVGNEPKRDIHVVELIRKAIEDSGKDVKVRLDANQGYNVPDAIRVIRELESTGELESVEQPVKKSDYRGLKEIRQAVLTPIMIDETVFGPEDAMQAISYGCGDVINLKTCKVGGIFNSKKIASIAEAADLSCAIGSNLELGIGIAASMQVAASTPVVSNPNDFICGVYLHDYDLITSSSSELVNDGKMQIPEGPGLGVDFNTDLIS